MKMPSKPKPLTGQRAYLKHGGSKCIACGSKNIEGGSLEMDGASAWCVVDCNDCGASWKDVYKLSGWTDFEMSATFTPTVTFSPAPDKNSGKVE
jgi:predicted nucleic-acid-binding Zn-ribbon protein